MCHALLVLLLSATPAAAGMPSDLIHHWRADGDGADEVGSASARLGVSTRYRTGISGMAFDFDGSQAAVAELPVDINPGVHPELTAVMWVQLDSRRNHRGWVFGHDNGYFDRGIFLHDSRWGYRYAVGVGGRYGSTLPRPIDDAGDWVCVGASWNAATATVTAYYDGLTQTRPAAPRGGRTVTTLGGLDGRYGAGSHTIDGAVDEVMLFDRALVAPEIDAACAAVLVRDGDGDGVDDEDDLCPDTDAGELVDAVGCSIEDLCPCDDPWRNHGMYVSCVSDAASDFRDEGLLTGRERGAVVSEAGRSDCGRR